MTTQGVIGHMTLHVYRVYDFHFSDQPRILYQYGFMDSDRLSGEGQGGKSSGRITQLGKVSM